MITTVVHKIVVNCSNNVVLVCFKYKSKTIL